MSDGGAILSVIEYAAAVVRLNLVPLEKVIARMSIS